MAETSNVNCDNLEIRGNLGNMLDTEEMVKTEEDVVVKIEPVECAVCVSRAREGVELRSAVTAASGSTVLAFLGKYTPLDLEDHAGLKYVCKGCYDLINLLEQAELEYLKLKEAFEVIISKNPMFECGAPPVPPVPLDSVKNELVSLADNLELDSEDEPLARTKKKRTTKLVKKKKKLKTVSKQKKESQDKDRWRYDVSDSKEHIEVEVSQFTGTVDIKTEDTIDAEQSQSPFNNGIPNGLDDGFGDFDDDDDDRDNNFVPEEAVKERKRAGRRAAAKEVHPCDQCSMQYTSAVRLERHKSKKHDGSKPPYICEVCGAHYKHKRACDIHIQLHKGISDWKCEECNKLFPSKNALQRHNNIHTGKLNYQCDLCGKSFIHTSSFKMHKLSHSGVKSHACDVCGLALMTRSHLKRHKRIHSGEKRHECGVCGKRFSERYNLAAHSKSHDAGEAGEGARRRLFRCPFCGERFERRYMLERHAAAEHGRALERPPPTPRNTMSKLLKAQAAARARPKEPAWSCAPDFLRPADYPH